MMKVNRLEMLIKFAAIYICISLVVLSASVPLSGEKQQKSDKESSGAVASKEDYDGESSAEKTSEPTSLADTNPPEVFPESNQSLKNETALEILQSNTSIVNKTENDSKNSNNKSNENNGSSQATNVDTSRSSSNNNNASKEADYDEHANTDAKQKEDEKKQEEEKNEKVDDGGKDGKTASKEKDYDEPSAKESDEDDVENIQDEGQDQGTLEEKFGVNSTSIQSVNVFEEPTLKSGHIALIFASSLIVLSAIAYAGLVIWRKSLEHRYGMRQRLVTEDDYYNNNDVRFFGL